MKTKAATLSPRAREMADVQSGKIAPGRVWIVKRRADGTVERRQVSATAYQARRMAESAVMNTALPARRAMGVSQDRFAELLGISPATVRNLEQGRTKPTGPTARLLKLAEQHPKIFITSWSGPAPAKVRTNLDESANPGSPQKMQIRATLQTVRKEARPTFVTKRRKWVAAD